MLDSFLDKSCEKDTRVVLCQLLQLFHIGLCIRASSRNHKFFISLYLFKGFD